MKTDMIIILSFSPHSRASLIEITKGQKYEILLKRVHIVDLILHLFLLCPYLIKFGPRK